MVRWNAGRLTIYLAVTSICLGVLERVVPTDAARLGALAFFFAGGAGGIPGTAVWLVVVSLLPPEWSVGRRRGIALATSPLIQVFWLTVFVSWDACSLAAIFGLLLPAGSAFVVRLRERRVSSPFPPDA